jgi:hypothetical protein
MIFIFYSKVEVVLPFRKVLVGQEDFKYFSTYLTKNILCLLFDNVK